MDSDHHRAQWIQPHYIHPTPRSTPCPRTTHANTTPLAHTIKMPNKLRQAHSHTRMQTHQPLHICSSSHIHAHKLTQHPSMSPEYVNIFTKNTLLWRHAMPSRQIKVAPLYFINKWPSFYCVWCIIAGYSEDKCFYNLSLKCKSFHRLWNNFFADATRAAWAGRNNIISSNIIA